MTSITVEDSEIMSGAIDDPNHQTVIRAQISPAVAGVSVTFTLDDPSPSTITASLSDTVVETDSDGLAETTLTSSNTPDEGYSVTVGAKCTDGDGSDEEVVDVLLLLPDNEFYEPEDP